MVDDTRTPLVGAETLGDPGDQFVQHETNESCGAESITTHSSKGLPDIASTALKMDQHIINSAVATNYSLRQDEGQVQPEIVNSDSYSGRHSNNDAETSSIPNIQQRHSHESPYLVALAMDFQDQDQFLADTQPNLPNSDKYAVDDNQESPTQVKIQSQLLSADDLLPDTQFETQKITQSSFHSSSPAQLNHSHLSSVEDSFNQEDDLLDTQANHHNEDFLNRGFQDAGSSNHSISSHFPSTKRYKTDKNISNASVGSSHEPASQIGDIYTQGNTDVSTTLQDLTSVSASQCQIDSPAPEDEDIPDTQKLSDTKSQLDEAQELTLDSSYLGIEEVSWSRLELGAVDSHSSMDDDLPATQKVTSNVQGTSRSSQLRYEESQATQEASQYPMGSLPSLKDMKSKAIDPQPFQRESTATSVASFQTDISATASSTEKAPLNKLSCRERKRIATSFDRPASLTKAMKQWITKTHRLLDPFREDDDCWFHPAPPPARLTRAGILRPCGKLQKRFAWSDHRGKHSLVLNYGIVSKIINFKLTKQQKDGFINKQWHLSHLCGNWTCLNPRHTTVEPGKVNISRNNCFSHRSGCLHDPECLKDKKAPLAPDGRPINNDTAVRGEATQKAVDNWDDWSMQSFDDGEVSVLIDDQDETEFALDGEDEDADESEPMDLETGVAY